MVIGACRYLIWKNKLNSEEETAKRREEAAIQNKANTIENAQYRKEIEGENKLGRPISHGFLVNSTRLPIYIYIVY